MYKSITPKDYIKYFSLPLDYKIEGLLSYGSWDFLANIKEIESILIENNINYSSKVLSGFLSNVLEIKINNKNYWFVVTYGGAMLSEYVHLACLFESKKNIHLGSCGGLKSGINFLDLIIPTYSFGDESSTRMYADKSTDFKFFPEKNLSFVLEKEIKEGFRINKGPIITNQAMMGESIDNIKLWSNQGYFAVEMETSTFFAVSNYFNIPSSALLYVSDNLIENKTIFDKIYLNGKERKEKIKRYILYVGLTILIK